MKLPIHISYVYALAAVLLWSTVATAFKLTLSYLDTLQMLLYASISSLLLLSSIVAWQGKFKELLNVARQDWKLFLGLGLLNPCAYYLILFKAYDLLPAQQAQPLNYTWAITLTLLSIPLLKQRISRGEIFACLLSYVGVVVIATRGDILGLHFDNPSGVGLALFSTLIWALYWLLNAKNKHDATISLCLCFAFALPFIFIATLLFSTPSIEHWQGLAGAIYIGIFEMGIAFVFWLSALRCAKNTAKISNLIFLSPFISLYLISTFLGESIETATYVGLVLILAGVALQSQLKR